ncbi:ER membrane protein complex subunit 5-like [Eriocheir sinensis]|uniref:ER membrane protein complex subunit 5-like n=1 Tax=Eriocheir sinensis TaxID=95602 RepID=UPI0021CAD756|nr:ER membrane protein complex subunit 5-like [Eriocheir sinensis]
MAVVWARLAFIAGIISLFHAGYSAAQHRSYLRVTEQEYTALPTDISVQGLLSLLLAMYGILHIAGDFKEIRANVQLQNKSWETVGNRPTFYIFAHRGRALSPNYVPPRAKSPQDGIETLAS